jgi:hypothetical protein
MMLDGVAVAQLKALTVLAGDGDLEVAVLALAERVGITIPSYLVMRVTIHAGEQPFTITAWKATTKTVVVRSSMRLEIPSKGDPGRLHSFIFFAEEYDAFAEFQEQWTSLAGGGGTPDRIERLIVDDDVSEGGGAGFLVKGPGDDQAGWDHGAVDRAIGVLMSCGFTVEAAKVELAERARHSNWTAVEEAKELLHSLRGTVPSGPDRGPVRP